ncbi:MAG TPA: alginate lyase family protein, partial [candidate division Zixibacteria bacterium]|nr:alginate lyase family protein [candidate division Zixibacteria bacterium]
VIKPAPVDSFFKKHWRGNIPDENYFHFSESRRFFFDLNSKNEYVDALKKRFSASREGILSQAHKIVEHRFDLLGSGETSLGEKINWHRDFKSGFEWPKEHYTRIKTVDLGNRADVKIPWELSRLQFVTTLGRAYWLTGESKYKEQFVFDVTDWIKSNPVDFGVNWTCSMEVAIRAINIIWGLNFFGSRGELTVEFIKEAIRSLYYHAIHIERNLEFVEKGSNTNHLLSNYLGMFYIGLLFPEFDESEKWLKVAKKGLEQEIVLQIMEDGADYECSLSYHRLVLEIFLSAFILGTKNKVSFSDAFIIRLNRMIEFSSAVTAPSGTVPSIGDIDDGFIVKLANSDPHDHRALLDVAAQLLDAKIPDNVELSEERLWYAGPNSLSRWPKMANRKPQLFKKSGYFVIQNSGLHLVFNAAEITEKGFGGHKHNDLLSICLEIDSIPFLIDAGTACYTSDYLLRNKSRSTSLHNTIRINGQEQSRFLEKALFFMFRDARAHIDLWTVTDDVVLVSGWHNGYSRLGYQLIHRRTIEVALNDKSISIWDEITGTGNEEHTMETNFLSPWNCVKSKNPHEIQILADNRSALSMSFESLAALNVKHTNAEYYPRYGVTAKGTQISCYCRTTLPFNLHTRMTFEKAPVSIESLAQSIFQGAS